MDKTLWYKEAISSIGFSFLISSTVLWSPGCFKQHKYRLAGGSRPPRKKEVSLSSAAARQEHGFWRRSVRPPFSVRGTDLGYRRGGQIPRLQRRSLMLPTE